MVRLFIILEIIVICMIFVAMGLLLTGDGARAQKLMAFFLCGSLVQNVGYLLELTADSMDVVVAAIKVENLGSLFIPLCYCWFIYEYCYENPPKLLLKAYAVVDFAMLPFFFFDNGLLYRHTDWMVTDYGYHYISIDYGPLYYPFMILRFIVPYVWSLYILIHAIRVHSRAQNRQYKLILAFSMLPVLALLAYVGKILKVFDVAPLVLGLSMSLVAILVWSRRNYDFRYMAADVVLNNMGDGIIALDEQRRLVSYNPAAASVFVDLGDYRVGEPVDHLAYFREEMLDEDRQVKFEIGQRYYESHTKRIIDENGRRQGYVILVIDVTDTRNYIDEIKRVRKQAEQANIAKSEFLANMSHEIRTPMNAIIGLSSLVMEESTGTDINTHVRDIRLAAQNLLAIINDILDLSKVEAGKMELVMSEYYIKGIVGEVVGMMDMAASQRGLVMKFEFDETIPCRYYGDDGRIKQILINLLNNAVKFTKEGYVRISTGGRPGEAEGEELLIFQVEDTGCGIRPEDQDKIFEDFKQVDSKRNRSTEGTGLGLSIVRHLVGLMHGTVELHSVYGEGTTFTVTIPQKIVDARTLAEVPEVPQAEAERTETFLAPDVKVLIVDDNLVNRRVARGFLSTYGFDLTEAASGPESIALVKEQKFDLIFMDHMMPGMDGIEAVEIIRRDCGENGTSPIIVALTANAMEGVREKFLSSGFQDFIAKPLERKPLNRLLLRWIPEERREETGELPPEERQASGDGEFAIEGIDLAHAAGYHAGSPEDFFDLLELFSMDGERKALLLEKLVTERYWGDYQVEVHGLKSAAANIGAMELSNLARDHEEAAERGEKAFITDGFAELKTLYEGQIDHIRSFLAHRRKPAAPASGLLEEMAPEELYREVKSALDDVEDFRPKDCAARLERLLEHRMRPDVAEALRRVREQLRLYEDDAAEQCLRELLETMRQDGA